MKTIANALRHVAMAPVSIERAVATYAAETRSPYAHLSDTPQYLPSFAGFMLALRVMRDRPDLLTA